MPTTECIDWSDAESAAKQIAGNWRRFDSFAWSRGYGAFSVSQSNVNRVVQYIAQQEEHHRTRTFGEELQEFINRHGLRWKDEGSR